MSTHALIAKTHSIVCQEGCGACCIAPAISSPIPGMPKGKKAGEVCVQLDSEKRCRLFGSSQRPEVCSAFMPEVEMCSLGGDHALSYLSQLELTTTPLFKRK